MSNRPADRRWQLNHPREDLPWHRPPRPADVDPPCSAPCCTGTAWQAPRARARPVRPLDPARSGARPDQPARPREPRLPRQRRPAHDEALDALTRCPTPSARGVLISLAVPSDEIRWWRDTPGGPAGAAPGRRRPPARRRPADAAPPPRSPHARVPATTAPATAVPLAPSLADVLVGPAAGAAPLTAFAPVPHRPPPRRPPPPRPHAAREAIDYRRATGGMDAFDGAIEAGVSRELTEALSALVRAARAPHVAVSSAPGARHPRRLRPLRRPRRVLTRRPARAPARPAPATCVPDPPYRSRSPAPSSACAAPGPPARAPSACVLAGADVPHLRVTLDEEDYASPATPTSSGSPSGCAAGWSAGAASAGSPAPPSRTGAGGRGRAGPADEVPPGESGLLRRGVRGSVRGRRPRVTVSRSGCRRVGTIACARAPGMAPHPPSVRRDRCRRPCDHPTRFRAGKNAW